MYSNIINVFNVWYVWYPTCHTYMYVGGCVNPSTDTSGKPQPQTIAEGKGSSLQLFSSSKKPGRDKSKVITRNSGFARLWSNGSRSTREKSGTESASPSHAVLLKDEKLPNDAKPTTGTKAPGRANEWRDKELPSWRKSMTKSVKPGRPGCKTKVAGPKRARECRDSKLSRCKRPGVNENTPGLAWLFKGKNVSGCKRSRANSAKSLHRRLLTGNALSSEVHSGTTMKASKETFPADNAAAPDLERLRITKDASRHVQSKVGENGPSLHLRKSKRDGSAWANCCDSIVKSILSFFFYPGKGCKQ